VVKTSLEVKKKNILKKSVDQKFALKVHLIGLSSMIFAWWLDWYSACW